MTHDARGRPRVVVTGIGVVGPTGIGREAVWAAARAGRSGAGPITLFDASDHHCRIACEIDGFRPEDFIERRAARRMDRVAQLAVAAGRLALEDAGLPAGDLGSRAGAVVASGGGGNGMFEEQHRILMERGADRVSPLAVAAVIVNNAAAQVSMTFGLGGPLSCPVTACASGNNALGDALAVLRRGAADLMLAGGTEAPITPLTMAALDATRALSGHNDDPEGASRPFSRTRDGFVAAEAGAILVLETLEHALGRGAQPLCELAGYGMSADAYHLTDPSPDGQGQVAAMRMALDDAGLAPGEVDHVNAHGTSTPTGDPVEVRAIRETLGADVAGRCAVSSTKSMHGHAMGAAGGIEGAMTALAIHHGEVPPTINLDDLDPACTGVDHVAGRPRVLRVRAALSNSFGFGGQNAVIAMRAL